MPQLEVLCSLIDPEQVRLGLSLPYMRDLPVGSDF